MFRSVVGCSSASSSQFDPLVSAFSSAKISHGDSHSSSTFPAPPRAPKFQVSRKLQRPLCRQPSPNSGQLQPNTWKRASVVVEATSERGSAVKPEQSTPGVSDSPQDGAYEIQSKAPSHLDLLEQLTSQSVGRDKDPDKITIAEQLATKVVVEAPEATIPLGKKVQVDYDDLTISQKRNIRRQQYLDKVSKRNDAPFFTTVALFVILPPVVILGIAVATGYVDIP